MKDSDLRGDSATGYAGGLRKRKNFGPCSPAKADQLSEVLFNGSPVFGVSGLEASALVRLDEKVVFLGSGMRLPEPSGTIFEREGAIWSFRDGTPDDRVERSTDENRSFGGQFIGVFCGSPDTGRAMRGRGCGQRGGFKSMNAIPGSDRIHVLLVEDSPVDVLLFMDTLRGALAEFEVETVSCLRDAFAKLDGGGVDVVISDLALPDSTGIDTFHRLAAHPARVPIVLITGLNDEALALSMVEEGAQDYLLKGQFDQALLVRSIRYAIKRAEAERVVERERNLLRSVIDSIPDAIYVKDAEGRYLLYNAAHMRQVGVTSLEEMVGKTCADFAPAERAAICQSEDSEVIQTGRSRVNAHELLTMPGGARRWVSSTKVPLRDLGGQIIGMIRIAHDITARKATEEQLVVSMRELKEKNAEMEDDLNMAREVQLAFLPQQFSVFPRRAAPQEIYLRFISKYLPTTTLGGDFFHIMPISETEVGVFICDVMGHGVRAALVTAIARGLAEELEEFAADPGEFLTQMNASMVSILRRTRSPMFASGFYMVVNVEQGRLQFANAGHPCPLHLKRDRNTLSFLEGPGARMGPALGVFEDLNYASQSIKIAKRDVVVLYTDGLYEVEGLHGDFFDRDRLLKTLGSHMQKSTDALFENTLREVRSFSASGAFIDDVCLVGVEVERIGACALAGCGSSA